VLENVLAAIKKTGIRCALMLDTKGPEIRTGLLKGGKPVHLKAGQDLELLLGMDEKYEVGAFCFSGPRWLLLIVLLRNWCS
jgi:pyruvate kinase